MKSFPVYLSSLGSKSYFPDNTSDNFSNALNKPLVDMNKFEVCLAACYVPTQIPVLICTNIVAPANYNEKQMPVVGMYSANLNNVKHFYVPVVSDTISTIRCWITDITGTKVKLDSASLIVLQFREKTPLSL